MLVELFAVPGAGKTTVANLVTGRIPVTNRKNLSYAWAKRPTSRRLAHVAGALFSPSRVATAMRFGAGTGIKTVESGFRLMRLLAKSDWLRSQQGMVLLDQGLLQDLWSILVSGKSQHPPVEQLTSLIQTLYRGIDAKIVVIDIDPQTAAERIRGRTHGHSRLDALSESELQRSLVSANELLHRIVQAAKLAGLAIHTLDGTAAPEVVGDQLLSLVAGKGMPRSSGLPRPRRISIIGSTGSGKTYLAKYLADQLGLPVFMLDELRRNDNGEPLPRETFQNLVSSVTRRPDWIVDGHYRDVRDVIWSRAELVVWLNYSMPVVAMRLMKRFLRKRWPATNGNFAAGPRQVAAVGKEHPATWGMRLSRLIRTVRERREYGRLLSLPEYRDVAVVELRSIKVTRQWLRGL